MVATHIRTSKKDRTYIYIPSFLRKDFNITKDSTVDITKENGKIVITIINAGDSE
jgi:bifunctional DNA-binding transcriptional regulator/antitoxin component of YhaV-PrlF toxin-antitoxin module